jgi:hypothetical protein
VIAARVKPADGTTPPGWLQCPATTKAGTACRIEGELARNGQCHIHQPDGRFRQNLRDESMCWTFNCNEPVDRRGLCKKHYQLWLHGVDQP